MAGQGDAPVSVANLAAALNSVPNVDVQDAGTDGDRPVCVDNLKAAIDAVMDEWSAINGGTFLELDTNGTTTYSGITAQVSQSQIVVTFEKAGTYLIETVRAIESGVYGNDYTLTFPDGQQISGETSTGAFGTTICSNKRITSPAGGKLTLAWYRQPADRAVINITRVA